MEGERGVDDDNDDDEGVRIEEDEEDVWTKDESDKISSTILIVAILSIYPFNNNSNLLKSLGPNDL